MSGWETTDAPATGDAAHDTAPTDAWGSTAPEGEETETVEPSNEPKGKQYDVPALDPEEFTSKARDAGWNEKTAFNYAEFERLGGDSADYHASSKVYEWQDDFGDVAPEIPELERILFGGEFQMRQGEHINNLKDIEVSLEGPTKVVPVRTVSRSHSLTHFPTQSPTHSHSPTHSPTR